MLLMAEQHQGKLLSDDAEAQKKFLLDNMGVFLGVMVAAAATDTDLIEAIITIRTKWLNEST